jgi:hypothetical protein
MKRSLLLWILALLITLISAIYQRMTGPTYPLRGEFSLGTQKVTYKLPRAHIIGEDHSVSLPASGGQAQARLFYRRLNSNDEWMSLPMQVNAGRLQADLPEQPTGGKVQYYIELDQGSGTTRIPPTGLVVTRFRHPVPASVLIPHILIMFVGMLLSTRTGMEALKKGVVLKSWTWWTLAFIFVGGMFFGPLVQDHAFGEYWTGIPFGTDLTDNKTLIALVAWLLAALRLRSNPRARAWVIGAAVVTLIAFAIPHSMMGTEVDHLKTTVTTP